MTKRSSQTIIAIAAITAALVTTLAVVSMEYFPPPNQNAMAQSDNDSTTPQTNQIRRSLTYFVTDTASVPANGNASAQAFCQDGDVLLTGGYIIEGFDSPAKVFRTELYSNSAFRIENATSAHEGWQAGLANIGTEPLTITANAVCLDVTSQTTR
jgi:hypothetical protein